MEQKQSFKPYLGLTFLIGLGFFTMGLMDPLYDTYVPIFLSKYLKSKTIIGAIMTFDNFFAIFLIPIVAALSDKTRTPIGRRMPYIIVTLPATAIFFGLMPFAYLESLLMLIGVVFILNLFKQAARGPVVALMPDIIPGEFRSEANGVINTMGGLAAILGTIVLAPMMDIDIVLPLIGSTRDKLPFIISGMLVVFATILLFLFIKEKKSAELTDEEKVSVLQSLKIVVHEKDKSAFYILIGLFLWFLGYQGVLPFIGIYCIEILGTSKGIAGLAAGFVGIAYALFAIPSGMLAHKIGRKKVIRISLIGLVIVTFLTFMHPDFVAKLELPGNIGLFTFWGLMFFFGMFWGAVVTNSFPMLWQMASFDNIGIYTGLYYFFSQAAAITAPFLTGFIIDISHLKAIFLFASFSMAAAFVIMGFVTKGEVEREVPEGIDV